MAGEEDDDVTEAAVKEVKATHDGVELKARCTSNNGIAGDGTFMMPNSQFQGAGGNGKGSDEVLSQLGK